MTASKRNPADTREYTSELRRWCTHTETHMDVKDGGSCEACYDDCDECRDSGLRRGVLHHEHRARLRRMLVCKACEMGFFSRREAYAHECFSAY